LKEVDARLRDLPELKARLVTIGKIQGIAGQASEGVNLAQVQLKFTERDERQLTLEDLLDQTRERLAGLTDCLVGVYIPSIIGGINAPIQLFLAGNDLHVLDDLALGLQRELTRRPGYAEVDTSVREGKPTLKILPRRTVLSDLGVAPSALGLALRGNLEGLEAGTYKQGDRNYDIIVKLMEDEGRQQVNEFMFPGAPGRPLLVTALGDIEESSSSIQILRRDKRRVSRLTGTTELGLPLGHAVAQITELLEDGRMPLAYDHALAGDVEYMAETQSELGSAALTALVLVVLCLAAILESWRYPGLILVTVPLGLIGIVWALFFSGQSFSVFVIMGAVMLIGIVVNNAILIVDQFSVHRRSGQHRHQAMIQAATDKFRPIAMISIAAVLGMLPLAIGRGIGAELRNGVGAASAGGILVSGLLTMVVLPVIYDFFTRRNGRRSARPGPGKTAGATAAIVVGCLLPLPSLGQGTDGATEDGLAEVLNLAEEPQPVLTLSEAKRIALAANPNLRASEARLKAARAAVRQTRAAYLPILSVHAGATHNEDVSFLGAGSSPYQHYLMQGRLRWLVFDGFARRYSLLAAKHGERASAAADREGRRLLLQAVAEGYYAALLSQEQARVAQQDQQFNAELYEETLKRQKAGTASRSEVLNFRTRTLQAENALLVIRLDYDNALTALAELLGEERAHLPMRLDEGAADPSEAFLPEPEAAIDRAWRQRPDLLQLQQLNRLGTAAVKVQQGRAWPTVSLQAGYGLNRAENSDVFSADDDLESFVGVHADWELYTGGSQRAQVDLIKAQTDSLAWQLQSLRAQIAGEVRDALQAVRTADRALVNQELVNSMSGEIRDIVRREYETGLASLTRLNEAQTDAVRAAGTLALARIERARAWESLTAATAENDPSLDPPRRMQN
jgi:outer membrane protein TolC